METSNVCHYCLNKVNRTQWLEGIEDVHFLQYVVLALSTITSVMIYHRRVSLSKQDTDLSLYKAGFVMHK